MNRFKIERSAPRFHRFVTALTVVGLLAATDLVVKWAMANIVMNPPQVIPVLPFFNLVLVFNRGVSFGLLGNLGPWGPVILSLLALGIIAFLMAWLWRTSRPGELAGLVLILGGAIGNLIDRFQDGAVTDFLDFYARQYHWPAFNLADTFIMTGVACLLVFGNGASKYRRKTFLND